MPDVRYRCKCQSCKHEWTSHKNGTPNNCPQCRSRVIAMSPLPGRG